MSVFADQMLLRFMQDSFVHDLLTNELGLANLFQAAYEVEDVELKEIALSGVPRRQFQRPAFETVRTSGINERIMPAPERVKVDRTRARAGRLAWVEVLLEAQLATKVHDKGAPIEKITAQDLVEKLGGVNSTAQLRTKLKALYPDSVVDAFFKELRITTVEEFKRRGGSFLEFVYQAPPPFDTNDPRNARAFELNICVQFQPELKLAEALQAAKLCRNIMENERNYREVFDGGEVLTPYVFVVIFPDSLAVDNAIPGLTAAQLRAAVKTLFTSEKMFAHFAV